MNRLKHICGINVSRHIPSNAVLLSRYGQCTDVCFENHQFKSQVSKSDRLFLAKKNHDVDIKYSKQFRQDNLRFVPKGNKTICKQRSKTKSSVTSLKKKLSMKKLPLGNVVRAVCHYSTCQNVKFNSSGFNKRHKAQIVAIINGAKNINHHDSFVTSVEKYPRSYAEMIADYSETLHKASTVGGRNDSLYFDNTIRKSPFSTFSTPSSVKKIVNVIEHDEVPIEGQENHSSLPADSIEPFHRCIQYDKINTVKCHNFQHHDTRTDKAINKINSQFNSQDCRNTNDLKDDNRSYAKLVTNCNKSMPNISLANVSNGLPSKNILTRNSLQSFVTPRKANSTNTQEALRKTSLSVATISPEKNVKEQLIVPKKHNWLKEIESVTSDLKSVIEKRTARAVNISKLKESDIPQFVDASNNNSPHKIHRLTKLIKAHKQKEKDITVKKLNDQSDKMEKRNKDFTLQKHNYSQLSNNTSSLPQYFSSMGSPVRKNSTQVSTSGTTISKQPHVKLRMVPSEKESVVSINVDSVSTGLLDSAFKQLSVVVQSDRKEDPQSENQWTVSTPRRGAKSAPQRNDFGPMRISISEDSAPVKQIEFSINGKPVSELKSITARTERLDVVSSMDKIEIRIPFAKDNATPSKIGETDLSKETDSSTGQILNVQISANFQNESGKGSAEKSRETTRYQYDKDKFPVSSSPISKSFSFNDSAKAREDIFGSDNMQQHGFSDNTIEKNINKHKASGDTKFNIQRKNPAKNFSTNETTTDISLSEERNNFKIRNLNTKETMNTVRSPMNKYDKNESSDHRVPSKMIPWWASSDSFNNIKKKKEDPKSLTPSRNKKKAISNLSHNFVTESLPSKWKETSNSTILTKKIQSINDTTINNNSNNLTSYSNSVEQYVESKPTVHCSYSFRLKPKKNLDIIPNIVRNNLKDNQMSVVQEDEKIFGIIQTKPIPLSISDATNINELNVSKREKASVLQENMLNSAQDLLSNRNREKKDNYSLKQTKSIDDVFSTKSKIKNTSDPLKLIEKRKDDSIDYNLRVSSRKPIVKLNNRVSDIQSPPAGTIITKDLMSNISPTEIKEQIVKTIPVKQTKLDKTKKSEPKMNILKLKENPTVKNVAISDVNQQKKNDVKNIQQVHQNDVITSHFLKSTQTLKKQDKLAEDAIIFQNNPNQNNKNSLLEYNKNKPSSSSSIRISSGTIKKSEKLGISVKMPSEESKQNRPNSLSNIKNISETIQQIEKLKSLTLPKSKESLDKKIINQKKSPLEIINEIQTKYNTNTNKIVNINNHSQIKSNSKIITSKIEDRAVCQNSMNKSAMSDKIIKKINKRDNAEDKTSRIVTQNPENKSSLLKKCEKKSDKSKSGKDKRNPSRSADSLSRKSNDSTGFKSTDSNTKSIVKTSNDNCTYERKSMLMEPLYPNFNRRGETSNSQSAMFKTPRNLHNDMLDYRAPRVVGSAESWINIDRPEKSMLYSVWLQQSRDDINKNKKLF